MRKNGPCLRKWVLVGHCGGLKLERLHAPCPKAVKQGARSLPTRWGQPERERLDAMLQQGSLFYWKGPQTTLMLEQLSQDLPGKARHDRLFRHRGPARGRGRRGNRPGR